MVKLLIADDDRDLADWLGYSFRKEGYTVVTAFDGEAALRVFRAEAPDLVLLDLKMPKRSGVEVLQEIRRVSQVPIILLTGIAEEETAVKCLKLGGDDYVIKPFRPRELRARAEAVLRRKRGANHARPRPPGILRCGELELDTRSRAATVAGKPVKLTPNELAVLEYLLLNQGSVCRSSEMLMNVWGYDTDQDVEIVRVTISRLRRKIEADAAHPRYILNVPGEGYVIRPPK